MDTPELARERLAHAHALELLQQVHAYLLRLPAVPVTREVARQVEGFLADPQFAAARVRAQDERALAQTWEAGSFTSAGEPLLLAQVRLAHENEVVVPGPAVDAGVRILTVAGAPLAAVATERVRVSWGTPGAGTEFPAVRMHLRRAERHRFELLPNDASSDEGR